MDRSEMKDINKTEMKKMFIRGKKSSKMLEELSFYIKTLEEDKDYVWGLYHKLKEEYNKDEEISKLKQEIDDLREKSMLSLNQKEMELHKAFSDKHYDTCYKKHRGSTTHTEFYGTGIGNVIIVKCPCCGDAEDISDMSKW